jgi:hypothetical protein
VRSELVGRAAGSSTLAFKWCMIVLFVVKFASIVDNPTVDHGGHNCSLFQTFAAHSSA